MNETTTFEEQIKDLHAQAEASYSRGDLQEARQIWEAILQVAPQDKRAEEGLRLTTLADANWALVEQSTGGTPNRAARIAAVRECLGSGLAGEAEKLAEALCLESPGDGELEALLKEARAAFERSSLTVVALREARVALQRGDRSSAEALCRRVLEIDPRSREAGMLLEEAEGIGQPPSPVMDLELDLVGPELPAADSSAPLPPESPIGLELDIPAPPRIPPAAPHLEDDPACVKDLFDAVEEIADTKSTGAGGEAGEAGGGGSPEHDEAALLISRARGELKNGNHATACELASKAMVVANDPPGAQSVLEQAHAAQAKQGAQAESLLVEAVSILEDGHPAEAIEKLELALELVPGHLEVVDYLARARSALAGDPPGQGAEELEFADVPLIPLVPDAAQAESQAPPGSGDLLAFDTGAQGAAPPPPPVAPLDGPPLPPLNAPLPEAPQQQSGESRIKKDRSSKARAAASASGLVRILGSILLLVILGTAGWFGYQWWMERRADAGEEAVAGFGVPASLEESGAIDGSGADEGAEQLLVDSSSDGKGPATRAPRYSVGDVPRLMIRASKQLAKGNEEEALELLLIAQELDASSFEILDRIQAAKSGLRKRRQAEDRIAAGKDAFAEEGYEEALRVFYRVPKEYQPEELKRWIANGWYNLGVRALQTGNVVEATRFFSDCLELSPGDAEALRAKEVSRRYRRRSLDDAFRIYVSRMSFRRIDD